MKKIIFFLGLLISFSQLVDAQVKIGAKTKADPSSVLELESTSRGLLISRLTTEQVKAITSPATGLLVYNTDLNVLQINTGAPASPQWANLVVSQGTDNKGAAVLPAGADADRPAAPTAGMLRYNTTSGKFEGYNGTAWVAL